MSLAQTLAKKGWGALEVKKTTDILAHAEATKNPSIRFLEQLAYWTALLIAILGNFILSVVTVPFLLVLKGFGLYLTIFLVGIGFGLLFSILLKSLENLGSGQHIIAGAFIPALALINIALIAHFSNKLEILLQLTTPPHSPTLVSITYVTAFVLPFLLQHAAHDKSR
jgi:hypothetical protein